jgi:hypothetical protein
MFTAHYSLLRTTLDYPADCRAGEYANSQKTDFYYGSTLALLESYSDSTAVLLPHCAENPAQTR